MFEVTPEMIAEAVDGAKAMFTPESEATYVAALFQLTPAQMEDRVWVRADTVTGGCALSLVLRGETVARYPRPVPARDADRISAGWRRDWLNRQQLTQLRAASSMRPLDRTSAPVDGLPLFDVARSPSFL